MKSDKNLSDALGIAHEMEIIPPEPKAVEVMPEPTVPKNDQEEDYRFSRKTLRSLIENGNSAIGTMTELARQSESPRAYEVLATMMKTIADTTKDLYDLQKKTKDLIGEEKKEEPSINVEKAVFVGSTAELLKQIRGSKGD